MIPKPDPKARVPDPEDFAVWCEHPITRFVATVWQIASEAQRDEWTALSWGTGVADPLILTELRTRADAYRAFLETGLEQYAKLIES